MCLDLVETYISAIAITATLESILPYLYRYSFAMCVFNHLHIDPRCGPFGYLESFSYAIYICRMDDLYLMYRSLHTGQSEFRFYRG